MCCTLIDGSQSVNTCEKGEIYGPRVRPCHLSTILLKDFYLFKTVELV